MVKEQWRCELEEVQATTKFITENCFIFTIAINLCKYWTVVAMAVSLCFQHISVSDLVHITVWLIFLFFFLLLYLR